MGQASWQVYEAVGGRRPGLGRPEMSEGICPPRPPPFGYGGQRHGVARLAEVGSRTAQAQIRGEEGVRVTDGPQCDVRRCPGPIPRMARSRFSRSAVAAPGSITKSPAATAPETARRATRRASGIGNAPGWRSASSARPGRRERVGDRAIRSSSGRPAAITRFPARERAAFNETCCPIRARTATSKPSAAPATRRPGTARTKGANSGSAPRAWSTASGSESRLRRCRQRATATVRSRRSDKRKRALT